MMRQQDEDMLDKELDFKREMMDRQAVASGNVDENSALYRHAKLNGWAIGKKNDPYSGAGRKWLGGGGGGGDGAAAPRLSGFGANMDTGRATRYYDDGSQQTVQNGTPAQQMFAQMGDLIQQGNAARQRKRGMDDAALASGLVYAKQNGGFIPRDILQSMSAQLGTEIAGGNYTSDGNFVLYGKQQVASPNGRVRGEQFVPIAIADRDMQMKLLQRSGLGQDLQKELWDTMTGSGKLTPQQVMDRGIRDPYAADKAAAERAAKWQFEQNEKARQFNETMKLKREELAAKGGGTGSGSGTGGKYDDKYAERLKGDWQDLVEQYGDEPTPEQQKKIDAARARYDRYVDSFGGGEGVPDGGGEGMTPQQRAQAILAARRQNGGGATEPENTASTPAQGGGRAATATAARQPKVAATSESVRDEIIGGKKPSATAEKPTAQTQGSDKPIQSGSAVLSAEDERFLDEALKELEAPEEPDVSVSIPSDSPDYERRVRNAEAIRKREELPDWAKKLSPEEQTKYKAARAAKRGIEAIAKEIGKTQGAASATTADSYAAMLDALGPGGTLRKKLSRLLSIVDKVGGNLDSNF